MRIPQKYFLILIDYGILRYTLGNKNADSAKIFPRGRRMEIQRDIYLRKLIAKKNNRLIKIVTGIRRCGKSYLLFNLFKKHLMEEGVPNDHILEMAFDLFENKKYRNPEAFFSYITSLIVDKGMYYVLLDEVQLLGEFESICNSLAHLPNVDLYVTGSNAKFLSKDVITEFRGRGDEIRMYPLTFKEFMSVYPFGREKGWKEYLLYGGIPLVLGFSAENEKMDFLKRLVEETYIKDIVSRNEVRNKAELEEILDILSSGIGSLTNPKKLSDTFRSVKQKSINANTISKYIGYFEDSFLLHKARRFDVKGKKYIDTPLKFYFSDIGLRNARINFRQIEETHAMENVIFNELLARGYAVDVGVVVCNETDPNGNKIRKQIEIDFVCNRGSKRYYIQSALQLHDEKKKRQEERPLLLTKDGFKKIIITKDALAPLYNEEGILVMNVFDFLMDDSSLDF